jgi:histidinol-phosphate phosphatase family protein
MKSLFHLTPAAHRLPAAPAPDWTLFLDRDGVINHAGEGQYITRPEDFVFLPGVPGAIARLSQWFGRVIVITNQQCVGKGLISPEALDLLHQYMTASLTAAGGRIDRVYHCPHLAAAGCTCRKPLPGMVLQAAADDPHINFSKAVFVGDALRDLQVGRSQGMVTVFIAPQVPDDEVQPWADAVFAGLPELADWVTGR